MAERLTDDRMATIRTMLGSPATYPTHQYTEAIVDLLAEVKRLEAELARLKAALPKTADGVTVVPAMELWCHQEGWATPLHFTALAFDSTLLGVWQNGQFIVFQRSYSTEAAARAAKENTDG